MTVTLDSNDLPPNLATLKRKLAPSNELFGFEFLEADLDANRVRIAFTLDERFTNHWGAIQGGVLGALMDDALGTALGLTVDWGQIISTLELKVNMIRPAMPGRLIAEAWLLRRGRTVGFVEGRLLDAEGRLIATASTTARVVTLKREGRRPGGEDGGPASAA